MQVFPTFVPGQWSYGFPVKKSPSYNTVTQTPASKRGQLKIALQTYPIWKFDYIIPYLKGGALLANSPWQQLIGFFGGEAGAGGDWLFNDLRDNSVTNQVVGISDGTTTIFPMVRTLPNGLLDLIQNFNGAPIIKDNGTVVSGGLYSIDTYGNLTFTTAPLAGHTITWTGSFYFMCHFLEDTLQDLQENMQNLWEIQSLKFESVLR